MKQTILIEQLDHLEIEMRALHLWREVSPGKEALASKEPFCLDTMGFDQWLQWVFVARLRDMLSAGVQLPGNSEIYPLALEFFKGRANECATMLQVVKAIDETLRSS